MEKGVSNEMEIMLGSRRRELYATKYTINIEKYTTK